MSKCYSCSSGTVCTKCNSPFYLDTGTHNCISDCLTLDTYKDRVWADSANTQCKRCDANTAANMTNCLLCTNAATCTKCDSSTFLDNGSKNCITDCVS